PPNDGTLPSSPAAVPDTSRLSPIAKTRKPAATTSSPRRRNVTVTSALATMIATPSIAQNVCRSGAPETIVPATPNTAPMAQPAPATISAILRFISLSLPYHASVPDDGLDLPEGADRDRGIGGEHDEVGRLADFERAERLRLAEKVCRNARGCSQRLERRQ